MLMKKLILLLVFLPIVSFSQTPVRFFDNGEDSLLDVIVFVILTIIFYFYYKNSKNKKRNNE
tara:strand:+ start:590 stop:775 length:186 start_codon:yes stop_codon:yes gene_type:complete